MKRTATYKDLIIVLQTIVANVESPDTKGQKKLIKIHQRLMKYYESYQEKHSDNKLEYAEVDEKGKLILNEKGEYSYSKPNMKLLNDANKKLLNEEFEYDVIEVVNPGGLEIHNYLENWVTGVSFISNDEDEI